MPSKEISFWINERWYDALSKHLKNETLEEHLEDVVDQMCNQLPEHEYERISQRSGRRIKQTSRPLKPPDASLYFM